MTKVINAEGLEEILLDTVSELVSETKDTTDIERDPHVVIITATDDKSSHRYVANKEKTAEAFCMKATKIEYDSMVTNADIAKRIQELNKDKSVDGIILQLPLYKHLNASYLLNQIDIDKDIDGLSIFSKGLLEDNEATFTPCTPFGVMLLLEANDIDTEHDIAGKNVVIIGRGETSGAPMSVVFRHLNANVTILHSKTSKKDLEMYVKNADIVISCVGKRNLLKATWFKEDSIVIGVGFMYDENGKQHLDFELDEVVAIGKAKYVTARTKATGKSTVLALIQNTALAYVLNAEDNFKKKVKH